MCPDTEALTNDLCSALFSEKPLTEKQARLLSPLTLAFVGDAVFSLFVRETLTLKANRPAGQLHRESIALVNAAAQSKAVKLILPYLKENETDVFKRGRNAHSAHSPKHQSDADYRAATGFEALCGYLYLSAQRQRLSYIFTMCTEVWNENFITEKETAENNHI